MTNFVDWKPCGRHLDSIILTKDMYWKAGGFDEDFRGYWNGVSAIFRKAMKRCTNQIVQLDDVYSLLFQGVIPDSENTEFGKGGSKYDIHTNPEMSKKQKWVIRNKVRPKDYIRFTWEKVL